MKIEEMALNLKALLTVLSAAGGDNAQAMQEMPYALQVAVNIADELYAMIVNTETGVK